MRARIPHGWRGRTAVIAATLALASCAPSATQREEPSVNESIMNLTSSAFGEGEAIPVQFTCDGKDRSPPLAWSGAPEGTAAFSLVLDDPDARGFVHWLLAGLPGDASTLDEGSTAGAAEGRNDFGSIGYRGPCPPSGTHRYVFTFVALSAPLELAAGFTADELNAAVADLSLATATLTGTYEHDGS